MDKKLELRLNKTLDDEPNGQIMHLNCQTVSQVSVITVDSLLLRNENICSSDYIVITPKNGINEKALKSVKNISQNPVKKHRKDFQLHFESGNNYQFLYSQINVNEEKQIQNLIRQINYDHYTEENKKHISHILRKFIDSKCS